MSAKKRSALQIAAPPPAVPRSMAVRVWRWGVQGERVEVADVEGGGGDAAVLWSNYSKGEVLGARTRRRLFGDASVAEIAADVRAKGAEVEDAAWRKARREEYELRKGSLEERCGRDVYHRFTGEPLRADEMASAFAPAWTRLATAHEALSVPQQTWVDALMNSALNDAIASALIGFVCSSEEGSVLRRRHEVYDVPAAADGLRKEDFDAVVRGAVDSIGGGAMARDLEQAPEGKRRLILCPTVAAPLLRSISKGCGAGAGTWVQGVDDAKRLVDDEVIDAWGREGCTPEALLERYRFVQKEAHAEARASAAEQPAHTVPQHIDTAPRAKPKRGGRAGTAAAPDTSAAPALDQLSLKELQTLCRQHGVRTNGKKEDLRDRLALHFSTKTPAKRGRDGPAKGLYDSSSED
eukprot:TRINITY_DN11756_c0_g1_i1.p1 TRINITY_DN11756_c0_g1~~TRINITY_DN11756_c0_g1_i1.p1  ORF type:complete len:409 (+),score=111.03 TRINITY_DN11756_c0_g1_i1:22-1248(+)